jgi:hypothetical protein
MQTCAALTTECDAAAAVVAERVCSKYFKPKNQFIALPQCCSSIDLMTCNDSSKSSAPVPVMPVVQIVTAVGVMLVVVA